MNPVPKTPLLHALLYTASLTPALATIKANTGTNLADGASWTGGIAPTTADVAQWDSTSLVGPQTVDSPVTWNTISIVAGITGPLSITGSQITISGGTVGSSVNVITNNATQAVSITNDVLLTGGSNGSTVAVGAGAGAGVTRIQLLANTSGTLTFGNVTASGTATVNDVNLWLRSGPAGNTTNGGTINGNINLDGQLAKGDTGIWNLNGANTLGWLFINNGTLRAGNNQAFGTGTIYLGSGGGNMTLASTSSTARSYANSLDFAPVSGAFTGVATFGQTSGGTGTQSFAGGVNLSTAVRQIATNTATTFSGVVSGAGGGITKTGAASLTLSNTNSYTGATNVNAGTLIVNGSIATSSLTTVASGATLSGSGIVGALTVSTGGFVNPGNSPGILNTGNLILPGTLTAEINGITAGSLYDQLNVTGTVNLTGGSLTMALGYAPAVGDLIFLIANDGPEAITGNFTGLSEGAIFNAGGQNWQITYAANSLGNSFINGNDVAVMAVPEPAISLLGGLGALALLRRRRQAP